jgi:hypothetical protein
MPAFRPLVPIPELGEGAVCADDVRGQLLGWKAAVEARGGRFVVNSLTRTCPQQQVLRDQYTAYLDELRAWKAGGSKGKAPAAVAAANKPGRSNHQAGRAVDLATLNAFPHEPASRQVDLLWETGAPFGFSPIIAMPDEKKSERWHFDCWNDWVGVHQRLGYETACLCAALDVGQAGEWQSSVRLVQALLLRAGFDIGEPDGVRGQRTRAGLRRALGADYESVYPYFMDLAEPLRALPAALAWTKIPR